MSILLDILAAAVVATVVVGVYVVGAMMELIWHIRHLK